jgi:peptidoglycan/LPS O-acetylase OafA/YrhL
MLANLLLLHNLAGLPSIDLVNWSLCIELKFYLLAALLAPLLRRGTSWLPAATGLGLALLAGGLHVLPAGPVVDTLRTEIPYLVFMMIGTLFTLRLRGRLGISALLAAMAVLLVLFVFCWRIGPQAAQYPIVLFDYGYALTLFSACFLLRRWIRPFWLLDRLADISFPLYLVHLVVGTSVMKLALIRFGWSPGPSLLLALAVVLLVSIALHRLVERRSIAAGRALALY